MLPKFVTDHLVLREISYQTYAHGVGAVLVIKKKDLWPNLPLMVGSYNIDTTIEAEKLAEYL